jgi:DNA-binding GntR family transcriptional regulator
LITPNKLGHTYVQYVFLKLGVKMLDLSSAYILDGETGMGMSQAHQHMAQAIAERYPNVRLAQVPNHFRTAAEEFPFALVDARTNEVLKEFREKEVTITNVFRWLYEHDTAARGVKEVYEKYIKEKERKAKAKADAAKEHMNENLDVVHSMANSPLHTFKHGDRKFSG